MKNRRLKMVLVIVTLVVLSPILLMAVYVDDWSRDLSNNVAWTDPEAGDAALRPVDFVGGWDVLQETVMAFAEARSNWSEPQPPDLLPADSPLHGITNEQEGEIQFHLVRTTGLMRYQDDVWVVADPIGKTADGTLRWRLHGHSQSRVGKGDLGQNPRNLRELLSALR